MRNLYRAFGVLFFFFVAVSNAQSATLYFSPASGTYEAGQTISLGVYVSNQEQAMNAVSSGISFPADRLEVVSFSKSGSIVPLWVQEPSFSNTAGTVSFEGVIPNPGYQGSAGKLLVVNFKVKNAGTAAVSFSSGSVLVNDGAGTDILTGRGVANFTLAEQRSPAPRSQLAGSDAEKPILSLKEIPREDITDPRAKFSITASDKGSGISHFEIKIDNSEPFRWQGNRDGAYEAPALQFGNHTLVVKVFDTAGNVAADSVDFVIQPLESPIFTNYEKTISIDEVFVAHGTTRYKDSAVTVFVRKGESEPVKYAVKTDTLGNFTLIIDGGMKQGAYSLSAEVSDERGAKSAMSNPVYFAVRQMPFLVFGTRAVTMLSVFVPLVLLLLVLIYMVAYLRHRYATAKKRLYALAEKTENSVRKSFNTLSKNIDEHILALEKAGRDREFTMEEEVFLRRFKKDATKAELAIEQEIDKVKRSL